MCETTINVGRKLFRLDGMVDRLLEKANMAMGRPDRDEPPVDYERDDDDIRRLAGIIERLAQRPPDNGYREAPKPRENGLKGIIIGCTITIVSAGIIGAVMLSNQFAALRAEFTEWKTATEYRLQQLERRP